MPPAKAHKTLTAGQKELLRKWIEAGAEYEPHWSYIVPTRPLVPNPAGSTRLTSPIDAFILAALASRQLTPSPEADRRTLLRRLSLDLIGLPPTSTKSMRLSRTNLPTPTRSRSIGCLKSPRFGERMAEPWLDVARYADTVGLPRRSESECLAVSRLRHHVVQQEQAVRPVHARATGGRSADRIPRPNNEPPPASCGST